MSNGFPNGSIWEMFLGFSAGVVWLLLAVLGVLPDLFGLLELGGIGRILNLLIGILGFLAFLLFGACIFKRAWRCCFRRKGGC